MRKSLFERAQTILAVVIDKLPVIIPLVVLSFTIASVLYLIQDNYQLDYILATGTVLSIILVLMFTLATPNIAPRKERTVWNTILLLFVLIWTAWNILFTAQHLLINRDPGIYTNAAIWLTKNETLKPDLVEGFTGISGVLLASNGFGFSPNGNELNAQGLHALPSLLAIGGKMFGVNAMLHLNILLGAAALFAIYAAARLLVAEKWALLATVAMGASLPFIYFSRDTYSEPLAATFTFAGIALLGYALKHHNKLLWLLSGVTLGATTMTRIDAYIQIAAVILFLFAYLIFSKSLNRKSRILNTTIFTFGLLITAGLSTADLLLLSEGYFKAQLSLMNKEALLIAIIAVIGVAFTSAAWKTGLLKSLDRYTRSFRAKGLVAIVIAGVLILMSRPLWFKGYLFAREGVREADTVRSFSEYATYWVSWYTGDIMFIFGILGLAMLGYTIMKKWHAYSVLLFIIVASSSLAYFLMPSIYPDQIWGARRMLPVIMPGLLIMAVLFIAKLTEHHDFRKNVKLRPLALYLLVSAIVLTPIVVTSRPILKNRDTAQQSLMNDVCRSIPQNTIVVWPQQLSETHTMATRNICDVSSIGYSAMTGSELTKDILATLNRAAERKGRSIVVGFNGEILDSLKSQHPNINPTPVSNFSYLELERRTVGAPGFMTTTTGQIYLAKVDLNGSLTAIEPVKTESTED